MLLRMRRRDNRVLEPDKLRAGERDILLPPLMVASSLDARRAVSYRRRISSGTIVQGVAIVPKGS
jgi:hypothetical protein